MISIVYYKNSAGEEMGLWPGTSIRTKAGPRKKGQLRLGKVIDKEKHIFFNARHGYYRFDPDDQSIHGIPPARLADYLTEKDQRQRRTPVIVRFGGSYFLHRLLTDIEYLPVIDSIDCENYDRLHAMFLHYALSNRDNRHAENWYMHSFAKYLYPKANLVQQSIPDFLSSIGTPENMREFLSHHIDYLLSATDREKRVLVDDAGNTSKCSLYMRRMNARDWQCSAELWVIMAVQKSTGLPLYYKIIPGNAVDMRTVEYVIRILKNLGCEVEYVIGDAGDHCLTVMESMTWTGLDFMSWPSPCVNFFNDTVKDGLPGLERPENRIDCHGCNVCVRKVKRVIAHDKDSGNPVNGYVYLCQDIHTQDSLTDCCMSSREVTSMTGEECLTVCGKSSLFAIVTTRDLPVEEVLRVFSIRQTIEPFLDDVKCFGGSIPVHAQSMETLSGHLLLVFAVTFVKCLIEYRLNDADSRYSAVQQRMQDDSIPLKNGAATFIGTEEGMEKRANEEDCHGEICSESSDELFEALEYQMADVFDDEIVPEQMAELNGLYSAYGLHSPNYVERRDDHLIPVLRKGDMDACSKILAFSRIFDDDYVEIKNKTGTGGIEGS